MLELINMEYTSKGKSKIKDSNNKNKQMDKYYTNGDISVFVLKSFLSLCEEHGVNSKKFKYLEPCAGGGSFLNAVEEVVGRKDTIAFDIAPEDKRIVKANFLEVKPEYSESMISIGNPPFGYKGDLAAAFINKCSEWGDVVVFILPIQFRRYNIQKRVSHDLKLIVSSDNLPKNSFSLEGKKYNVNCLYQIWVRKDSKKFKDMNDIRMYEPLPNKHPDFKLYIHNNTKETLKYFDKDKYQWDIAVYRQGFYDYNHRITDPKELQQHIQYLFIKYINPVSKIVFEQMDFEKLSHTNTSILGYSNTDVVAEYKRLKKELGYKEEEPDSSDQMSLFDLLK